ncbi:hypothetical protein MUY27_00250 [Mucilaginibacter sp. RS28]|uniref:Uncharacterized protein n=1 Tax=Mucilaginibacter straminoryzae TaxID=2932774 RepID=A0A9X1X0I4_9SPHI|nr:hypothetical protein [Mucilaginibacter straminoryzae]MCJ8208115.1 hypothetical protein [Mucilaginibacter straminoryzae]
MKNTKRQHRLQWQQLLETQRARVANRLNRYTARWPPTAWKIALLLFITLCSTACLWLMLHRWL